MTERQNGKLLSVLAKYLNINNNNSNYNNNGLLI